MTVASEGLLRLAWAAAHIDVPIEDLRAAAKAGELPSYRIAGTSFERADLRTWREGTWRPRRQQRVRDEMYAAAVQSGAEDEERVGFVYFIGPYDEGPIKIGWALDPRQRRRELQTGCWAELVIYGTVTGTESLERDLHRRLAEHHVRGEWFERGPVLAMLEGFR